MNDTQAELERQINEFNSEYKQRLGSLIEEILKKCAELPNNDAAQQQEARQDYEEFERSYQQQLKNAPQTLTPEQQQQLKIAWNFSDNLFNPCAYTPSPRN